MTTMDVGAKLVELCNAGTPEVALDTLYSEDIVSVEPIAMETLPAEQRGLAAIHAKNVWFGEHHIVHSMRADGPYPHGDRFIVKFSMDLTQKASGQRFPMEEMALFTVRDGKIVREEFFYATKRR